MAFEPFEALGIGGPYPALVFSGLFTLRRRRRDYRRNAEALQTLFEPLRQSQISPRHGQLHPLQLLQTAGNPRAASSENVADVADVAGLAGANSDLAPIARTSSAMLLPCADIHWFETL